MYTLLLNIYNYYKKRLRSYKICFANNNKFMWRLHISSFTVYRRKIIILKIIL